MSATVYQIVLHARRNASRTAQWRCWTPEQDPLFRPSTAAPGLPGIDDVVIHWGTASQGKGFVFFPEGGDAEICLTDYSNPEAVVVDDTLVFAKNTMEYLEKVGLDSRIAVLTRSH